MDITRANPQDINITLNGGNGLATGKISATSHAAFTQRVVLKIKGNGGEVQTITFEGSGENVPMKTLEKGETVYNMINWRLPITGTATFSYNDGSGWKNNAPNNCIKSADVGQGDITIVTEDATDRDDNDTVLRIVTAAS